MLAGLLLAACSREPITEDRYEASQSDSILIKVLPPPVFCADGALTKSTSLDPVPAVKDLPVGSTLWLTYKRTKDKNGDDIDVREMKGYVVEADPVTGTTGLFAMRTVSEDGYLTAHVDESTLGSPLYLEKGTYEFRIMSPAYPIRVSDHAALIDNGMYLYATDDRYDQTKCVPVVVDVPSSGSGVDLYQELVLNPIIQQVAQIQVSLKAGANVSSIEMMESGMEISGLQDPITNAAGYDYFPLGDIDSAESESLPVRAGDKFSRVYLPGNQFQMEEITYGGTTTDTMVNGTTYSCLTGRIGVLPTDARSSGISLLFLIAVNGVPTQYVTVINGLVLEHNHSYNMMLEINLDNAITVGTWQSHSWNADLTLE